MSSADMKLPQLQGAGKTSRTDTWWLQPTVVFLGLSLFIVYSTWAAFQNAHYWYGGNGADYLSPMYAPVLFVDTDRPGAAPLDHAWFGAKPAWWPLWLPFSPAFLILWAPGGFRFTCYYYRGAYYKSFWADPPSCAVGEPGFRGTKYRGERKFPLVLQNIHRYFMYVAVIFIFLLAYEAWRGMWFTNPETGVKQFGIGVGTLVLTLNAILLGGYTFGCHSLRHIVGGFMSNLSRAPVRKKCYDCVTCLNKRHMLWAWLSLFWVGFTDVYIRLLSMGAITDYRIL